MKDAINVTWGGEMSFEALVDEHKIVVDASPEVGGKNKGPRPKPLLMVSLAGCTGMDVVSILRKMKVPLEGFNIIVEGDLADEHPKKYNSLHLIYTFKGHELPMDKIKHAVELSQDKYCGVSASLQGVDLTYEIKIIPS
jgi:putative redox protein